MPDVAVPRPAATVLLLRDGPTGLEVFMTVRHAGMDFMPGALVFPGGGVDPADAALAAAGASDTDPEDGAVRVAAASPAPCCGRISSWRPPTSCPSPAG